MSNHSVYHAACVVAATQGQTRGWVSQLSPAQQQRLADAYDEAAPLQVADSAPQVFREVWAEYCADQKAVFD